MKTTILIFASFLLAGLLKAQYMDGYTTKFNAGYYYNLQGDKVNAEIKISCMAKFGNLPHNSIYVKAGDGKPERFSTKEIKAFVIGTDSFTIIKNVKHGDAELLEDFAHVDAADGDITTVTHYTTTGSGGDHKIEGLTLYIKKGITYTTLKAAQKAK